VVVDDPTVVVEAVKLAEDGSGDVVVRLCEGLGSRAAARITATFAGRGHVGGVGHQHARRRGAGLATGVVS